MSNLIPKYLPVGFFKDELNYNAFHNALCGLGLASRALPDLFTQTMANLYDRKVMTCLHIPHWHQIVDDDARTLRCVLQKDETGARPKRKSRDFDLLQYLSICLQSLDEDYARYVGEWCKRKEACLDDIENDDGF